MAIAGGGGFDGPPPCNDCRLQNPIYYMTQIEKQSRAVPRNMGAVPVLAPRPKKLDRNGLLDRGNAVADWRSVACIRASGIDNTSG